MLGTVSHFELRIFYNIFSLCSERMQPHTVRQSSFMVRGTVLLLKPAVKNSAKWLLCSLEGFPKCAVV